MSTPSLLYKNEVAINDSISIVVPTVGEVIDNEEEYYSLVSVLTAMPIDLMVPLDDAGIDFTTINEYELFIIMSGGLRDKDMSLIFKGFDFSKLELGMNEQNGNLVLQDLDSGVIIDRAIHDQIAATLREIHHLKKNYRKPANKEAKEFMIRRARAKLRKKKKAESQLQSYIVAMVNTEQFKYNYETVRDMTIFQFNESLSQIVTKVDYDNKMHGVYAGTVSVKDLDKNDLNWLTHK